MNAPEDVERRFQEALDAFVAKVREDRYVLAAILFGSLAYDRVWEKSDVDLMLISTDHPGIGGKTGKSESVALTENGVNLHVQIFPRSRFKKMVEGGLRGSFMHSSFSLSRLLFTRDETIRELYEDANRLGARDRQVQLFHAAAGVLAPLAKAEKWFHVRGDLDYCALWILYTVTGLARNETYLHHQIAGREAILQALEHNPDLYGVIYTELLNREKTRERVGHALELVNRYLEEKIDLLFRPLLDYLAGEATARSATEIDAWFEKQMGVRFASFACEWLAEKGVLVKDSLPMRLTAKSRVEVEEIAFYYPDPADDEDDGLPEGLRP
jgi:predicted nucleotidyltransferase